MQTMRRSRSMLVELIIAVLFLALSACILARLFAIAWETGEESRQTQASLIIARDALERFSAGEELPDEWSAELDGCTYEAMSDVTVTEEAGGYLRSCKVTVGCESGKGVSLETACYTMEAKPDEYM